MNLFGPHIHKPGMGLDLLERWKPPAALAMDVDSDYIRRAREKSPEAVLVVRVYEHGNNFLDWSPQDWVGRLLANFPLDKPDYFVTINEPFGHDSSELFERFDVWESQVIRLLQVAGTDGLACNFPTGNFTAGPDRVKIPDVFPRICAVTDVMGPHDYSWPDLEAGWSWYAGRWFTWYDDIKAATGKEMKFLVGECGLTQAIIQGRPDHGWQSESPENVTAESYLVTLHQYLERIVTWDAGRGIVLGLCLFNFYDQFHQSFEHINRLEVVDAIIAMDVPALPPPESPPEEAEVDIYDFDGNKQDWAWLKQNFGDVRICPIEELEEYQPQQGDRVYKVKYFRAKRGYTSCLINVRDRQGKPVVGETVIFGWRTAEPHGYADKGWNWSDNGAAGDTNSTGDVGPSMGTGAYYAPPDGGPHWCWVWDLPSEKVEGLGMIAGTFHDHLDVGYQEELYGDVEPPEPVPPSSLEKNVERLLAKVARIVEILEQAPPGPPGPPPPPEPELFHAKYYPNMALEGEPVLTRDEEAIDHFWGPGSPGLPVPADYFSARWTSERIFEEGTYEFIVLVDDGFRLWVDEINIIETWKPQAPTEHRATVTLSAGKHTVRAEYYEQAGGATCRLEWKKL